MLCECPDNRIYSALRSLNGGFLQILTGRELDVAPLGLPAPIAAQLRALAPDDLDFIAGTPVLLAEFVACAESAGLDRIADIGTTGETYGEVRSTDGWSRSTRLFSAALLTWLWQTSGRDSLLNALCIGPGERLPPLNVSVIESLAGEATERLRVRFGAHPRFWPDLIRAARSRDPDLRELSRLAVLPLVLAEENRLPGAARLRRLD